MRMREVVVAAVVVADIAAVVEAVFEVAVAADVVAAVASSQASEEVVDAASSVKGEPLTRRWNQWRRPFAPNSTLPTPPTR